MSDEHPQPEGSHVKWPRGLGFRDGTDSDGDDSWAGFYTSLHTMRGAKRGSSASWTIRLPNDDWVDDEAVTLEEMKRRGAV